MMNLKFSIDDILKDGRKDSESRGSTPSDGKLEFFILFIFQGEQRTNSSQSDLLYCWKGKTIFWTNLETRINVNGPRALFPRSKCPAAYKSQY